MAGWGSANEEVGSDVASAGILISERIGKEVATQLDLEEALESARYASHPYSSHPKDWPALFEVAETRELPLLLIEAYNAAGGEGTALCGIFPEIHRAWASVDNSLFLWRFDKWDGHCTEYSGEDQAICAVGLVRARPGIFVEAIRYLLVVATAVELILIGVCCSRSGDGLDPYAEISLQPLPEYTLPSDGITMTCVACTEKGHIFLAGRDGHIYEIQYSSGAGWHKRCSKVCLTAGISSLISRWVLPNVFKFGSVDPIVEMVIDNERNILYARTEEMKLQAFSLGVNGDGPLKKIAEERNFIDPREVQGSRRSAVARTSTRVAKPSIVCIAPLSTVESKWLHVVAVLSDGRRLYLSTSPANGNSSSAGLGGAYQRPCCLKVVATRPSPPLGVGGGLTFGAVSAASRSHLDDLALKVEAAFYSAGTVVLSDSSSPTMCSLLMVSRDPSAQPSVPGNFASAARSSRALRELLSSLPVEGRMLCAADVLPLPDTAATVQELYADTGFTGLRDSYESATARLWAKGDLSIQHILPRRRLAVFSTMGMMEIVFNRPVDILRKLFEINAPRPHLEDFFTRFGAGEAAAMCLLLATKLAFVEQDLISNVVAEKAAEAYEDPRLVGLPQLDGVGLPSTRTPPGGFSMGQVVQEAEPMFSGAYEGLCLCATRLLFPMWELPVMVVKHGGGTDGQSNDGVIACRLSAAAIHLLECKVRSLELFLRSRRNQGRGLYAYVAGLGDTGTILYGGSSELVSYNQSTASPLFRMQSPNAVLGDSGAPNKRQRLPYNPAELAAMEVRAMECLRRLLRRSSEALHLLQLVVQHHVTRLVQRLDSGLRQKLLQLTFHQLVCSEEGHQLAMHLISGLMEYYIGSDGRGTVDEISVKLRDGCSSYYNESDYKYFLAVECLERAAATSNPIEQENLARDAYNFLNKVPETADLSTVCKRFEDLRFYEAVVRLPLQKAQALDPLGDAVNERADPARREYALLQREHCYEIVMDALRSLKGEAGEKGIGRRSVLDQASRDRYIRQIIQLSVQWPDTAFHEHLYRTLIDLGLENELLEYGGSDLVSFLQGAARKSEVRADASMTSLIRDTEARSPYTIKYLELLAKYYVLKRQHLLAAHVLLRLADRQSTDPGDAPTLEQRYQYLSNAVLQAKSSTTTSGIGNSNRSPVDEQLLDVLEAKLAVLRFQMKIREELESLALKLEASPSTSASTQNEPFPPSNLLANTEMAHTAREKARELSVHLKSITQLYNEYALPFELWEICLEMLNFANYSGDADSKVVRETWARLLDQAISRGGVAEACSVLRRVGSKLYPGDGASLPLDTLCLHLEKAAMEHLVSGTEMVGDEDVARALLGACKGSPEPVLSIYDQLLSNGAIYPSLHLRLRLLRSVLVVLREWAASIPAQKLDTSTAGTSFNFGGRLVREHATAINQGIRDKIANAANRYMTEVRRLSLPQSQTEAVFQGFRELEEKLFAPF